MEPRKYRLRLLNGCDSRFLVVEMMLVELGQQDFTGATAVPFTHIGGDEGLGSPKSTLRFVFEPSSRHDVIFDFAPYKVRPINTLRCSPHFHSYFALIK